MTEVGRSPGSVFVQTWTILGDVREHDELMVSWLEHVRLVFPVARMRYFRPPRGPDRMRSWVVYLEDRESLRRFLRFLRENDVNQGYRSLWLELMRYTSYSVKVKHGSSEPSGLEKTV